MPEITPVQKAVDAALGIQDTLKFLVEVLDPEDCPPEDGLSSYARRGLASILRVCNEQLQPVLRLE